MTYLLDETDQEFDNTPQRCFLQVSLRTQQTEHVDEMIVHGIILGSQLGEEHARQVGNLLVVVFQAFGHLTKLTLDLDLTGQNKESQSHETGALDGSIVVIEATV